MEQFNDHNQKSRDEQSLLLSAKNLARLLNVSVRQVWRLNSSAKLPKAIRIGGSVRWAESTISKWLAKGAPDRATFEAMQEVNNHAAK